MTARAMVVATGLVLGACGGPPQAPITVVQPEAPVVYLPRECTVADPAWQDLPDRDVRRSEGARNLAANRSAYKQMQGRRGVCRAAIGATPAIKVR